MLRSIFPEYFQPTEAEFQSLWTSALVIPDTNVLLDLYRLSPETRDELLLIFEKMGERMWMPSHVAFEFVKNRQRVIHDQQRVQEQVVKALEKLSAEAGNAIHKAFESRRHHPFIDIQSVVTTLQEAITNLQTDLKRGGERYPDLQRQDHVLDRIEKIFENRIGPKLPEEELQEIYKEGKQRYANMIPPGFKDINEKEANAIYGDLVVWKQILAHAKSANRPVIVMTNDNKEDWWRKDFGSTLGPHPALITEMRNVADQQYYQYDTPRFMEFAAKYLQVESTSKAVNEVSEILQDNKARIGHKAQASLDLQRLFYQAERKREKSLVQQTIDLIENLPPGVKTQWLSDIIDDAKLHTGSTLTEQTRSILNFVKPWNEVENNHPLQKAIIRDWLLNNDIDRSQNTLFLDESVEADASIGSLRSDDDPLEEEATQLNPEE